MRSQHVAVLVADKMFVYGGISNSDGDPRDETMTFLNDVHAYDLSMNAWSGSLTPSGTAPSGSGRYFHSGVVDGVNMIVFGGRVAGYTYMNDLHAYNTETNAWSVLSPSGTTPAARFGHTALMDITTRTMYVYGGAIEGAVTNDLHSYNIGSDEWSALSPSGALPPTTYGHTAVFDSARRTMWVFVGYGAPHGETSRSYLNEMWSYDVQANRFSKVTPAGTAPILLYAIKAFWVDAGILAWSPLNREAQTMFTYDVRTNTWSSATASGTTLPTDTLRGGENSLVWSCAVYSSAMRKMLIFGGYLPVYLWQSENNFFAYAPPATTTSTGTSSTSTTTSTASNTTTSTTTTSATKTTSTSTKKTSTTTATKSTTETTTIGVAVAAAASQSMVVNYQLYMPR